MLWENKQPTISCEQWSYNLMMVKEKQGENVKRKRQRDNMYETRDVTRWKLKNRDIWAWSVQGKLVRYELSNK